MRRQLSESVENYLKVIYHLALEQSPVSTNEVAGQLDVAPASATSMLQKLAATQPPLVEYKKHQGVNLSPEGEKAALEIIRRHRLLETYLVTALGYSWDNVHEEACRLEHVISEEFVMRIARVLGNPQKDPHGEPIPGSDLAMPADHSCPLSNLKPHEKATITRVRTHDPALLRYLGNLGIRPGVEVEALDYSHFDRTLELQIPGQMPKTLGFDITSRIFIELQ